MPLHLFTTRPGNTVLFVLAVLFFMLISASALAGKGLTHNQGGIAIDGYDPVAYFTQSDAVEGDASITHDWQGATWQFSSSENRDLFAANPEAYAPQYGGYCAFAASNGYIAPTDANAWTVHDGRLYLNYSLSVRSRWSEDIPGRIKSADGHWPEIKKQL